MKVTSISETQLLETLSHNESQDDNDNQTVYVITNPTQPTGIMFDAIQLLECVKSHPQAKFIVDETYMDYVLLSSPDKICTQSMCSHVDEVDNLVVVKSFSKAFGLAGLRLGCIIGSTKTITILQNIYNHKDVTNITKSALLYVLQNRTWYEEAAKRMFYNQHRIVSCFNENGIPTSSTYTNFILFHSLELYTFLYQHGIQVRKMKETLFRLSIPDCKTTDLILDYIAKFKLLNMCNIWCISLQSRPDKFEYVKNELARNLIGPVMWHRPEKSTIGGEVGCWESHKHCLLHSTKELVMLFEDDVLFHKSQIPWALLYSMCKNSSNSFDTLYMGSTLMTLKQKITTSGGNYDLWRVACNQTHGYIVHKSIATRTDFDPLSQIGGVDDYYRRNTRQVALVPPICIQTTIGTPSDNQWFTNNYYQYVFQHPYLTEYIQRAGNFIASCLWWLPEKLQPFFNPVAFSLLLNGALSANPSILPKREH